MNTYKGNILIIDDEVQIRRLLTITLEANGYRTKESATGKEGLASAIMSPPDLILLDLGLPDDDGQNILIKLREWYKGPIIIITVRNFDDDIVNALDNGANDYLVKPFKTVELLARMRSAMRQHQNPQNIPVIEVFDLTIDLASHIVRKKGEIVKLTSTEYSLLVLLSKNSGKILTHQYILKEIWGPNYDQQFQYLRVFIGSLRKKIEDNPNQPKIIITETGIGYRFGE